MNVPLGEARTLARGRGEHKHRSAGRSGVSTALNQLEGGFSLQKVKNPCVSDSCTLFLV